MGLDMYLSKHIYIGGEYHKVTASNVKGASDLDSSKVTYLTIDNKEYPINWKQTSHIVQDAMYWRKANAIHQWFVDNVQDGNDDCREYWVSFENLVALKQVVCKVLDDHSLASKLLPTQAGFFFGGTDYDQWYFDDLRNTKEGLSKLIKEYRQLAPEQQNNISFYYQSSW